MALNPYILHIYNSIYFITSLLWGPLLKQVPYYTQMPLSFKGVLTRI